MPSTFTPLATTTLTGSAVITFSSISASFTDLRLIIFSTGNMGNIGLRYNGDTASNYSLINFKGDGALETTSTEASKTSATITNLSVNITQPALVIADIFSYSGSTFKTTLSETSADLNGSGNVFRSVTLFRSSSAINQISITCNSGAFGAGTTASLYGILKA